ncbi:MAG: carbohydrate-binding domain-containing protein [Clostridiales bacterium]|nr:carbohydrate-binding domain-containing protein [Clostridiales bacterium]
MKYRKYKKEIAILLALALLVGIAAFVRMSAVSGTGSGTAVYTVPAATAESSSQPVSAQDINAKETAEAFVMTTEDGAFSRSGNVYTVTSAGTYSLSGLLEGQILIDAGENDKVTLELSGVTVTCATDSPVKAVRAGSLDISAKKDTENVINDTRAAKQADSASQGEGAIYAACDLKLKGSGTLVVNAGYNNGVHTTKDLTVQKLFLKVTARNNAIKGNDSFSMTGGAVVAISTYGDGVKTENTNVNKNGVTRGSMVISGGSMTVYAAGDGFQAARNFELVSGEDGSVPSVTVYTGAYSEYTASDAATDSWKGVKVQNELIIQAGSISVKSYDDAFHADQGTSLDDGTAGKGTISISGGSVTLNVNSPEGKTMGGSDRGVYNGRGWGGRGGWSGQQSAAGADAIHADSTLNISGGTVVIESAYEGLEANVINISGGSTRVSANDDGVNACSGSSAPLVNISGGYLDVTVSASGDVDGIDSNGNYRQSGGVVITRGPSSQMAAALDADGSVSVTGGTLIVLGYARVSTGGSVRSVSLSLHSAGTHTVTVNGTAFTFVNSDAYARTFCYSDAQISA